MTDPTPAEIEAGIAAVPRAAVTPSWRREVVETVLRAVLPDHDARVRAQVAEELNHRITAALAQQMSLRVRY